MHMVQVFLFGAYKYPREITWITGCILLFATLGMAFTGQVLRFDEDAYWGLGIGAAIAGRSPVIGDALVHLMLGGPIIASETLSRFFSLHVFIIPGTILAVVALHLRLVLAKGINEYPKPGHIVRRATYDREYRRKSSSVRACLSLPTESGRISSPERIVIIGILFCALYFWTEGPNRPAISGGNRHRAASGLLFHVGVRDCSPHAGVHGDRCAARRPADHYPDSFRSAVREQRGREELAPSSGVRC